MLNDNIMSNYISKFWHLSDYQKLWPLIYGGWLKNYTEKLNIIIQDFKE